MKLRVATDSVTAESVAVEGGSVVSGAARRGRSPIASAARPETVAISAAAFAVIVLIALEIASAANLYTLRMIGDTPSFMALIRDLALHRLQPQSTFFATGAVHSIHASPYLQIIALIWRVVAPANRLTDPIALGRFIAILNIPMTLFVLGMVWLFTREIAGRTAAFAAIPSLLLVFGPVHITFPSDLTLNGFMYSGYYPTTAATGFTLASLVMLRRRSWDWSVTTVPVVALTLTTDPLNGAVLAALMILYACRAARTAPREALRIPVILTAAFLLARGWPAFDVFSAFAASGLPVPAILLAAFAGPGAWLWLAPKVTQRVRHALGVLAAPVGARVELRFAVAGAYCAALIAIWGIYTMNHWPAGHAVLTANRLGFYWDDQRDRWLLLFAPGLCGLIGLQRLARRGYGELITWFFGFYLIGVLGAVAFAFGVQIPLYYRFILLCQVPIAIGVAYFLAEHENRLAAKLTATVLAVVLVFKVGTLLTASDRLTYYGAKLPSVWSMGQVIAPGSGLVASDPGTSYYMPIATQNRVITLGLGHADSGAEAALAEAGYSLVRDVYVGDPAVAARALKLLWAEGVRWVVAEKFTSFWPVDLKHFYAAPYSALVTARDVPFAARYNTRLSTVANVAADNGEYTVYKLDPRRLPSAASRGSLTASSRPTVTRLLTQLQWADAPAARAIAKRLRALGVHTVTMSTGWLGTTPQIWAYGASIADPTVATVTLPLHGAKTCKGGCARARGAVARLGTKQLSDPRFVIARLRGASSG